MILEDPMLSQLADRIHVVQTPDDWKNISSTGIRKRVKEMRTLLCETREMLPPELDPLEWL